MAASDTGFSLALCVCLCMSRSCTWPSLKNSYRISPDTEGWIHEFLTPALFLCSSFLFLPAFEFQFRMRPLDMRVVFLQSREGALPAWRLLTSTGGRASWEGPPAAPAWPAWGPWGAEWPVVWPLGGGFSGCPLTSATGSSPGGSAGKESACNVGDLGSIPGLGRPPAEGKGYPLQYSGLGNSMDCTVHGVAESQTQLSNFTFSFLLSGGKGKRALWGLSVGALTPSLGLS